MLMSAQLAHWFHPRDEERRAAALRGERSGRENQLSGALMKRVAELAESNARAEEAEAEAEAARALAVRAAEFEKKMTQKLVYVQKTLALLPSIDSATAKKSFYIKPHNQAFLEAVTEMAASAPQEEMKTARICIVLEEKIQFTAAAGGDECIIKWAYPTNPVEAYTLRDLKEIFLLEYSEDSERLKALRTLRASQKLSDPVITAATPSFSATRPGGTPEWEFRLLRLSEFAMNRIGLSVRLVRLSMTCKDELARRGEIRATPKRFPSSPKDVFPDVDFRDADGNIK